MPDNRMAYSRVDPDGYYSVFSGSEVLTKTDIAQQHQENYSQIFYTVMILHNPVFVLFENSIPDSLPVRQNQCRPVSGNKDHKDTGLLRI